MKMNNRGTLKILSDYCIYFIQSKLLSNSTTQSALRFLSSEIYLDQQVQHRSPFLLTVMMVALLDLVVAEQDA